MDDYDFEDEENESYESYSELPRVEKIRTKKSSKNPAGRHYIKVRRREQLKEGLTNLERLID